MPLRGHLCLALLPDNFKRSPYFLQQIFKFGPEQRLLGIDDDIHGAIVRRTSQPNRLAQASLHPVAVHCAAQRPADITEIFEVLNVVAEQIGRIDVRPELIRGQCRGPALHARGVPMYALDKWALSEVVGFRVTRGVLAAADRLPRNDPADLLRTARRVAI